MTGARRSFLFTSLISVVATLLLPSWAFAGTWAAYGPKTYRRSVGPAINVTDRFRVLNPTTQYTLKASGAGQSGLLNNGVCGCEVLLNGVQVIGPTSFSRTVTQVEVPVNLLPFNTITVVVAGNVGAVLSFEIVGVDNDPPGITANVSPAPNAAGWNNSPVTVTFTCSDKTSGIASCPAPVTLSADGANQVVSGIALDRAGNMAATSVNVNLDRTPPTITGTINPPPDATGWNTSAVTVTFTCADALSRIASCPSLVNLTAQGAGQVVTGTATDVAGNTATTTLTVNISFNDFKIRSWQTSPPGDPLQTGKCLDYGSSPSGATVFLNDCANAHAIRVVELGPRTVGGITLYHEIMLFAGRDVIGIHNPPASTLGGPSPSSSSPTPTEYTLELQVPWTSPHAAAFTSNPANQIFAYDGDSIILESSRPCINTNLQRFASSSVMPLCPPPPPQIVIQIEKARGATGSPVVAGVRDLADSEFWDFKALDGSGRFPTGGFEPVASADALWNKICATPAATQVTSGGITTIIPPASPCSQFSAGWGTVVVISSPTDCSRVPGPLTEQTQNIGGCIDLSAYPPLVLPPGVTLRGNRRGISLGPQLYAGYNSKRFVPEPLCPFCMIEIAGDYARVTGLHLRGQSRSTDTIEFSTGPDAIGVDYVGLTAPPDPMAPPQIPRFLLSTVIPIIATIDHNDASDWEHAAIAGYSPFFNSSTFSNECGYVGFVGFGDQTKVINTLYTCNENTRIVPYSPALGLDPVTIVEDPFPLIQTALGPIPTPGTLANMRVSRNFLHHNERNDGGYGVSPTRALIDRNTFLINRHDISAAAEPHNEYRASYNLVLSAAYASYPNVGRLQDFDMHGTNSPSLYFGGAAGYYVEIEGNTFLAGDGHDYVLRGHPGENTSYYNNISRRNENTAVQFISCIVVPFCTTDYTGSPFPINISNSQFGQSTPDPTSTLGVGDFDGDGHDDLFMTTGAAWYYSPGGAREWRFLSAKVDRIDTLLLGDFDGDGRTDVVGMNPSGEFDVSWGGVSDWEVINRFPCGNGVPDKCPNSIQNMVVGDFDGDGTPDILYTDRVHWYISYGGTMPFTQVNDSSFLVKDLRFGHFSICGNGTETDVFGIVGTPVGKWMVTCGARGGWVPLLVSLTSNAPSADGLVVADFDGNGDADIGMPCTSGGNPGWRISYGGSQDWSSCNAYSSSFTLVGGGIGRFSGGPGADILLWSYYNHQGAAKLWDVPSGTGIPFQLSPQDIDMH